MKIRFLLFAALFLLLPSQSLATSVYRYSKSMTEEGEVNAWKYTLSVNKTIASADSKDIIYITFGAFQIYDFPSDTWDDGASPSNPKPFCPNVPGFGVMPYNFRIQVSGTSNTYDQEELQIDCSSGYKTITLKSAKGETKTISELMPGKGGGYALAGLSIPVSFKSVATTVSTPAKTTPNTTTEVKNSPLAPAISTLAVGQSEFTGDQLKTENQFSFEDGVIFSGTTIPNGKVILYFQSEPFQATVTADASGKWSYQLTKDLGEGSHTLQVAVTDPTTNLTSPKSDEVRFALLSKETIEKPTQVATDKETNYMIWYYIAGAVAFVLATILFVLVLKKRHAKKS